MVVKTKMADTSLVSRVRTTAELGEIITKNIAKTVRRQLGGQHPLFGEYIWTNLNAHYRR